MTDAEGNAVIDPERVTKVVLVTGDSQHGDTVNVTGVNVYTDLMKLANDLSGSPATWPKFDTAQVHQGDDHVQLLDVRGTHALAIRAVFCRYVDSLSKLMMRDAQRALRAAQRDTDIAMRETQRDIDTAMSNLVDGE